MRPLSLLLFAMLLLPALPLSNVTPAREIATLDDGKMLLFVSNNGTFAFDRDATRGEYSGLYFPKNTYKWVMSGGGIWVAGKKNRHWRISISGAESEFVPGPAYKRGHFPDPFPIYKVTRGENYPLNDDYRNWPVSFGAPVNAFGEPLISGSQSLFTLFADTDTSAHFFDISNTPPLGVEVKCYVYTYDNIYQSFDTLITQMVFFEYTVTNASAETIDSCIVAIYADPDIGYGYSDRVGCDSALNAVYCYDESNYDVYYGPRPPVAGLCFLENEAASVNFYYSYRRTDPPDVKLDSLFKTINLVKGLTLRGKSHINPVDSTPTRFPYSGNPVDGSGWIDTLSKDYRMVLNTAPIALAAHDSVKIKAALVVTQGETTKDGIREFLETVALLRSTYLADTNKPYVEVSPPKVVEIGSKAVHGRDWGGRYLSGGLDLASRYLGYDRLPSPLPRVTVNFAAAPMQRVYRFVRRNGRFIFQGFAPDIVSVTDPHGSVRYDYAFIDSDADGAITDALGRLEPLIIFTTEYSEQPKSLLTVNDLAAPADFKLLALELDGMPESLAGRTITVNSEALTEQFEPLPGTVAIEEPDRDAYSERSLSIRNTTTFVQEINIISSQPSLLRVTPARFDLGVGEKRNIFFHRYSSDSSGFHATADIMTYSFRNSKMTFAVTASPVRAAVRGDADGNGTVDLADLLQMLTVLYHNGFTEAPIASLDTDCDGKFDLRDLVALANVLYGHVDFPCDAMD